MRQKRIPSRTIEAAIFNRLRQLQKANFASLCEGQPFDRGSISDALRRLRGKNLVMLLPDKTYTARPRVQTPIDRRGR